MLRALLLLFTVLLGTSAGAQEVANPVYTPECSVWFIDDVTMDSMKTLMAELEEADAKCDGQILLIIESGGGSLHAGNFFVPDLERLDLHTHVRGEAASMAVILYLTGDYRTMAPGATLFVHNVLYFFSAGEAYDAADLNTMALDLTVDDKAYAAYVAKRMGLTEEEILTQMGQDTTMTADEAVGLKYANSLAEY